MKKKHSQEFLRKRKMLLVLPLLVIPFLSLTFYGLGGGKGKDTTSVAKEGNDGYNTNLPGAKFDKKDKSLDKVEAYKKADQDSVRLKEQLRADPYQIGSMPTSSTLPPITSIKGFGPDKNEAHGLKTIPNQDSTADVVLKRLDFLKQSLKQPSVNTTPKGISESYSGSGQSPDLQRLDQMMQQVRSKAKETENDPQLEKLNSMLDKIMQLQNPSLAISDTSKKIMQQEGYAIKSKDQGEVINSPSAIGASLIGTKAFFSTEDEAQDSITDNVINAIVDGDQTIVSGGTLDMRLTEEAQIKGIFIPRNTTIHGRVSLNGERMNVLIPTIKTPNGIFPVNLQVYDYDGLAGIKIPDVLIRNVAKTSANQAVSGINISSMDPSIKAQAASAGIEAAKTLVSKKVKLVKANVPNGHLIYLMNVNN